MTTSMKHIRTLNNFNFKGLHFLLTKEWAMGTVAALLKTIIYMEKFENIYTYPEIENNWFLHILSRGINIVNWITKTRKSAEHLRTIYGNTEQLFRPY